MKLITEEELKDEFRKSKPQTYYIPEGRVLSPAAKDYLRSQLVQIDIGKNKKKKPYTDYETGASYQIKPEFMTHMYGNRLVTKDSPMIRYRGKLDRLQAEIILTQGILSEKGENAGLIRDLEEILQAARELMRCELLSEDINLEQIIGLNREELREHSHHAKKYYGVDTMELPDHKKGMSYALLNLLRTSVRETEVMAVSAFSQGHKRERTDIIEVLNRLSSALHIMMCRYVSGKYDGESSRTE